VTSSGAIATSDEVELTTGDYAFEVVPISLAAHFNRDVVADAGDERNDPFDGGSGLLIVDGFDGTASSNPAARGLPADRRVGIHRLAAYADPNAVQVRAGDPGRRIEVPVRRYSALRFLLASGPGDAEVPVVLEYSDGTFERRTLFSEDWFDDPGPDAENEWGEVRGLRDGVEPAINGMDRFFRGAFEERNDAALFNFTLEVDPTKDLRAIVIDSTAMKSMGESTVVNLFAVTGVWVGER
jgi:hypothetical protein